jgi:hypothetical protein
MSPQVNTSQHKTPKAHTSDLEENLDVAKNTIVW